jgi:hypothetical protein
MKDADDPIPVGMISIRDARETVYRRITPDWQILQERVNPSSSVHHGLSEQEAKCSRQEAWRNYDKAQRRALKWLLDRISQEALVAQVRDPKTGDILRLDRNTWNPISDFEIEITVVMGARQPVFFDRKEFDKVLSEIAQPATRVDAPRVTDKGGRPTEYSWEAVKPLVLQVLAAHGKPHKNNPRLPNKAPLIVLVKTKLGKFDQHPADTAVKYHVDRWIAEFDKN